MACLYLFLVPQVWKFLGFIFPIYHVDEKMPVCFIKWNKTNHFTEHISVMAAMCADSVYETLGKKRRK